MLLFQNVFGLPYYDWIGIFLLSLLLLYAYFWIKKVSALAEQMRICNSYYAYLYPNDLPILWEDEIETARESGHVESLIENVLTEIKNRKALPKEAFEASKKKVLMWEKYFREFGFRDLTNERLEFIGTLLLQERIHLKYNESVFSKFFGQLEQREPFPMIAQNYKSILDTFNDAAIMNAGELNFVEEKLSTEKWNQLVRNVLVSDSEGQKIVLRNQIINKAIGKTDGA
jgi:hypothetical protein